MNRVFNFSAGPATLPLPVLERVRDELLDWNGTGASVMEVSHRGKEFIELAHRSEQMLRELLGIPENYFVLFLQGGAQLQFAMTPLNLLGERQAADYVNTGAWSSKAIAEGERYAQVNIAASSADSNFTHIPPREDWRMDPEAAYLHYTPNETIGGVEFHWVPQPPAGVPLVADMSSTFLSRPIDVSRFGLIYAGAQKNAGPAGVTIVIVRKDLCGKTSPRAPALFDYGRQAKSDSMMNTAPTFAWYVASLVFEWLLDQGGLDEMARRNARKAAKLYGLIDDSGGFYSNPVATDCRSRMNVPFVLAEPDLDAQFLEQSKQAGLHALKGHRSVGGMRASIYNAMPESGVDALAEFMGHFMRHHG